MRVAITGGTGLVGRALVRTLAAEGHDVVVVSRSPETATFDVPGERLSRAGASVTDREALVRAFEGTDAVAHLAGINREVGDQTFDAVHVRGTRATVAAAEAVGADRVALTSFLRARPNCGSGYLESKWRSEEIVREAPIDTTVLKPGVVYGEGDQMVTHIARSLATVPLFGSISMRQTLIRPVAVAELANVLAASVVDGRLTGETVPVLGPETLTLVEAVRRIGAVVGRDPFVVPLPTALHLVLAGIQERVMETPVIARAQVQMLTDDLVEPAPPDRCTPLPADLEPSQPFTSAAIERALGSGVTRYGRGDISL